MRNALSSSLTLCTVALMLAGCGNQQQADTHSSADSSNGAPSQGILNQSGGNNSPATGQSSAPAVTTPSGLQYQDLTVGNGPAPMPGQRVTVHYTGWLQSNGSKFDSSVDRGEPFTFTLGQGEVIKGWDEGVATMKVGGKRRLTIPASLGYGEQGAGDKIPPNATLVFDVELLGVQ